MIIHEPGYILPLPIYMGCLQQYQAVTAAIDDYENLSKFFGLMKHFNKGRPINNEFKVQIEQFFSHKWMKDHNQALNDDDEKGILE